jgi:hypothetical protein
VLVLVVVLVVGRFDSRTTMRTTIRTMMSTLFADLTLARRLESAEAHASAQCAEALARLRRFAIAASTLL